jgi:hypothetical protein
MPQQQKIAKKLPKRTRNTHLKEHRASAWKTGKQRKELRRVDGEARARANLTLAGQVGEDWPAGRILPSHFRTRFRPRRDAQGNPTNEKQCVRCKKRMIVAGSVCWCRSIGEGWA